MTDDELITHRAVLNGLSPDVQQALIMALPPQLRGWWTIDELIDGYQWIEVTQPGSPVPQFVPGHRR